MSACRASLARLFPTACFLLVAWLGLALSAQAPSTSGTPGAPPEAGADVSRDGGARDTARFFLLQRMREELQLTDSQSLKVLDLMRAMDDERRAHRDGMGAVTRKIRTLQASTDSTDAQFKEQVTLFQKEQARFEAKLRELEQKVLDALTPKQQAGFLVLKRRLLDRGAQGAASSQSQQPGGRQGRGRNRP